MLRSPLYAVAACLLAGACGGSSPSSPTQYPAMAGGWSGTLTIRVSAVGDSSTLLPEVPGTITCLEAWQVASQSDGSFSGVFQSSEGTTTCAQVGRLSGTMTRSGGLITLTFDPQIGQPSGCTRTGMLGFTGTVAGGSTLSAQVTEAVTCTANGSAYAGQRVLSFSLDKRT